MEKYDVVIPIAKADVDVALQNLPYIFKNLNPQNAYIIGNKALETSFKGIANCHFLDEDCLYEGMNYNSIKSAIRARIEDVSRTGWYFQQFLKMGYAFHSPNRYYLLWDADTVPVKPVSFFDDNAKPMFALKSEYHKPYFETLHRLLGLSKCSDSSFIAEHMLIDREIMMELIQKIEKNDEIAGTAFYEKIINCIAVEEIPFSGFSEFETYGTYTCTYYPEKYSFHTLKACRHGKIILGDMRDEKTLKWVSNSFDTISFEKSDVPDRKGKLARMRAVQRICSLKMLIKILYGHLY